MLEIIVFSKNIYLNILQISQSLHELEREYLVDGANEEYLKVYKNLMVENAVIFGANKTQAEKELNEAFEFEIKLANVSMDLVRRAIHFLLKTLFLSDFIAPRRPS